MNNNITSKQFIKEAHQYSKGKVCNKCNEHKLLSEFNKNYRAKDGHRYDCRSCQKEWHNSIYGPFKKWFSHCKSNKKQNGIKFTIEPEDIPGVKIREKITIDRRGRKHTSWEAIEYPQVCTVLGIKLDWGMNGLTDNSPSLDRDNNKLGYIKGNVMIMSNLANKMKSSATPEQLKQFSRYQLFGKKI